MQTRQDHLMQAIADLVHENTLRQLPAPEHAIRLALADSAALCSELYQYTLVCYHSVHCLQA